MKFDVVLGNPPYQQPNTKTHKLWIRFLQISKDLSNQYILMITPSLIWKPSSKLEKLKEDIQYNTSYLKFGVESHFPSQHTRFKKRSRRYMLLSNRFKIKQRSYMYTRRYKI